MNIQECFPLGLTDLVSCSPRDSQESSPTSKQHRFFGAFFMVQLSHTYMTTGKTIALTRWTFVGKVMSLLFNMLFARMQMTGIGVNKESSEGRNPTTVIPSAHERVCIRLGRREN